MDYQRGLPQQQQHQQPFFTGQSTSGTIPNINQFPTHLQTHLTQMSNPTATSTIMRLQESAEESRKRFEIECEFVQALANPHYLCYLAQKGYFKEEYFVNYLKYLLYFKWPAYSRFCFTFTIFYLIEHLNSLNACFYSNVCNMLSLEKR